MQTVPNEVKKQLEVFKDGCVELIAEGELTDKLRKSLESKKPLRIKYGVDPSTSDLHLGHTVPLFKLRALQELGHKIIFLIGDFTARIGDPSNQSETRKALSKKETKANAKTYADQVFKILDRKKTEVRSNSEWLDKLSPEEFLRLTSHTTVHRMIERDDFSKRFKEKRPISLLEFIYPLLQAYDSVVLKADVEVGGTDQKFNFLMGREMQRDFGVTPEVILTLPILEGTDGIQKMSKSLGNAIGVNLPPDDLFGKVMSLPDKLILPFFRYTTPVSNEAWLELQKRLKAGENPRGLKAELGKEIVSFFYGKEKAERASDQFDLQFRDKQIPQTIVEKRIDLKSIQGGKGNILLLAELGEVSLTRSEIRRRLSSGGIRVNGEKVKDIQQDFDLTQELTVQFGKREFRKFVPRG